MLRVTSKAMRATLPGRFALALDARAPRRSLGPSAPVTSGPMGQALLDKAPRKGLLGIFSMFFMSFSRFCLKNHMFSMDFYGS